MARGDDALCSGRTQAADHPVYNASGMREKISDSFQTAPGTSLPEQRLTGGPPKECPEFVHTMLPGPKAGSFARNPAG